MPEDETDSPNTDPSAFDARSLYPWMLSVAAVFLVPVAVIGAVLSYSAQYERAAQLFGPDLGRIFPLQVDLFIAGASLAYLASALVGRPRQGWRLAAHVGVGLTLVLNAMTAQTSGDILWHLVSPLAWAACVELAAHHVLGEWRVAHEQPRDRIPLRLWISAPLESVRTWLIMSRLDLRGHAEARAHVGLHSAAREALILALPPGRQGRRVRKVLKRQLRAGSLTPAQVLAPLGWTTADAPLGALVPVEVLRYTLTDVLTRDQANQTTTPVPSRRGGSSRGREAGGAVSMKAHQDQSSQTFAGAAKPAELQAAPPAHDPSSGRGLVAVPRQQQASQRTKALRFDLSEEHRPNAVPAMVWTWWVGQRTKGIVPSAEDWEAETGRPRATAGRWRRSCEAAEAERSANARVALGIEQPVAAG
jgi:hypothetical protein